MWRSPSGRDEVPRFGRFPFAPLDLAHPEGQLGGVGEGPAEAVGGAPFGENLEDLVQVPTRLVEPLAVALEEPEREQDRRDERRLARTAGRVERLEEGALRPVEVAPLAKEVPERPVRVDGGSPGALVEELEGEAIARFRFVPAPEDLVAGPEADGRLGLAERRSEAAVDLERPFETAARRRVVASAALEGREVREGGRDAPEVARALGLLEALPLHRLALLPAPGPGEDGGEGRERAPDEVAPFGPPGRLDGGLEPLLGRRVVATLERDRSERAEQERAKVVGQLGAREGEGRLGLGLGAVGVAPLEAGAGGGVEQAGPLLGRPDRAELPFRTVEEGPRRFHVSAAQPDHPDLEGEEGRVAADGRVVGIGPDAELLEEEVVGRERAPPVAGAEVDVAEPLANGALLGGSPREVEELENAAVGLRRLVVGEEPLGPRRRVETEPDGPLRAAAPERVERSGREEIGALGETLLEVRRRRVVEEPAPVVGERGRELLARPRERELPDRLPRQLPLPEKPREGERPEGVGEGVGLAHGASRAFAERDRREAQGQLERQVGGDDGERREELAPGRGKRRETGVGPLGRGPGTREAPVQLGVDDELSVAQRDDALVDELLEERDERPGPPLALVVDEPRQLLGKVLPPERAGRGVGGLPLGERGEAPGGKGEVLERREGLVRVGPRLGRRGRFGGRGDDEGPRLGRLEEKGEERRGGAVGEVQVVDEDDERPIARLGAAGRLEGGEDLVEEGEPARLLREARDGRRVGPGGGEARDPGEGRARGGTGRAAATREGREDVEDGPVGGAVLRDGPPFDDEGPFRLRQGAPLGEKARLARPLGTQDDDRLPRPFRRVAQRLREAAEKLDAAAEGGREELGARVPRRAAHETEVAPEVVEEHPRRGGPGRRVAFHQLREDPVEAARDAGRDARGDRDVFLEVEAQDAAEVAPGGRQDARERLVERDAEGVEVGPPVGLAAAQDLGSEVGGGAADSGHLLAAREGEAEVEEEGPLAEDPHVRRLHVAVDETARMDVVEGVGDVGEGGQVLQEGVRAGKAREIGPVDLVGREPGEPVGREAEVARLDDGGVVERGEEPELLAQRERLFAPGSAADLQDDAPARLPVEGGDDARRRPFRQGRTRLEARRERGAGADHAGGGAPRTGTATPSERRRATMDWRRSGRPSPVTAEIAISPAGAMAPGRSVLL